MMRLRLCENLRAFGYAPFYLALAGGHFAAAGLDIALITSPSMSRTGAMLLEGAADVSWGGPMRVMMHHEADAACTLRCFAQIVARDPFVLVGRTPRPQFRFDDLVGQRLAIASETPTPWLLLQDDIARAGIDLGRLSLVEGLSMSDSAAALRAGDVDVVQTFEPHVGALMAAGCHVWYLGAIRGDIAYTTFYATLDVLDRQREACRRLVRGMAAAQRHLRAAANAEVTAAIRPFFPETDLSALEAIVAAYQAARLWAHTPHLPPAAFVRLKAALLSGGLVSHDFPYDRIVDPGLSQPDPV